MTVELQNYRLVIISPVPVHSKEGQYQSLDLWIEDLQANLAYAKAITIVCPRATESIESSKLMPSNIAVVFEDQLNTDADIKALISNHDVVSIGVGRPQWQMGVAFNIAKISRKLHKCIIIGVSSNRAKTTTMNAKNKNILKKIKAYFVARSILQATKKLVAISSGVLVVGEGVRKSMHFMQENVYVEIATWICKFDIITDEAFENKLKNLKDVPIAIIATRLEPMKGVHLAIEALDALKNLTIRSLKLSILGKGPALEELQLLVQKYNLNKQVTFDGVRDYPAGFFATLNQFQLVLLSNLNDEQPRLIFDAISQGLVPICPDSASYQHLKLPIEIMYQKGDADSLAQTWLSLCDKAIYENAMRKLRPLAYEYTINNMHKKRHVWIASLMNSKS